MIADIFYKGQLCHNISKEGETNERIEGIPPKGIVHWNAINKRFAISDKGFTKNHQWASFCYCTLCWVPVFKNLSLGVSSLKFNFRLSEKAY